MADESREVITLSDDDTDSNDGTEMKIRLGELKKDAGNVLYKQQKYYEALVLYNEAISIYPECAAYYNNRAACQMMVQNYRSALEDVQQAVKLDPVFLKAHLREARCQLMLGDVASAKRSLQNVALLDPTNSTLKTEMNHVNQCEDFLSKVENSLKSAEYRQALYYLDQLLLVSCACVALKLKRAECLALLSRYPEAHEIANDILQKDNLNAEAIYIRGMCFYYQDNIDKAVTHFHSVLQLAPDHMKGLEAYKRAKLLKSKKEAGNEAFKSGNFQEAFNLYTSALAVDSTNVFTNAKLYFNRATVCSKLKDVKQSVEDASNAIRLDPNYTKAFLRRAKGYMELEKFEEAVKDYETIFTKDKTTENRRLLDSAKLELKKSKRKDYYKILGVSKQAGEDEIKKAYKKQALLHHPDRHSSSSSEMKLQQEKKFKELGEAYNILSDPKNKSRYDNGLDLDEDETGGNFYEFDPHMFSHFADHGRFFSSSSGSQHGYHFRFG